MQRTPWRRCMRSAAARCWIALFVLLPQAAVALADGSLGVYADATGALSTATFSIGVPRTLYVVARLDGRTAAGMSGAEFRVQGLPADWLVFVTPNPAATVALGDPFRAANGTHRANIAFHNCIPGNIVVLYTATVIPQSLVPAQDLTVEAGNPPTNPLFATPVFTLCDAPDFTKIPAAAEAFHFEVRSPQDLDYPPFPGYASLRGVQPFAGAPGDVFHFRVSYSNADEILPPLGSPRLELDTNGDGDALDAGEGIFPMWEADLDSTLSDGKQYRYDVALPAPPGAHYRYRFTAAGPFGTSVPGNATAWNDSLFVRADAADVAIRAENIRVLPESPPAGAQASIFARVENLSDAAVDGVTVRVVDAFGGLIEEHTIGHMGPHSATDVGCTWRFPDPGFQPIAVHVDPAGAVVERCESNNRALHGVNVSGVRGVLQISGLPARLECSPAAPVPVMGHAAYPAGTLPGGPAAGAFVVVRPSWEASWTLRANDTGEFAVVLVPPAAPGEYNVSFLVSDGGQADSVVTPVSVAAAQGNDGPHLPNWSVQVTAVPGAACPATSAEVSVRVHNTGNVTSTTTAVRILLNAATEVAVVPVAPLAPGSSVVLPTVQVPLSGPGSYAFTVLVDAATAVRELRGDDNSASATVQIESGCFDLALIDAQIVTPDLCTDTSPSVSLYAVNRGCTNTPASRIAAFADGQERASVPVPALAAKAAVRVELLLPPRSACTNWTFVADPDGTAGADCAPESNSLSMPLCPGVCPPPPIPDAPDFVVQACDIRATPNTAAPGSPAVFSAWITNHGNTNATLPVAVHFRVDGADVGAAATVGPIAAGSRMLATASAPWAVDLGLHELSVSIDAGGQEAPGAGADNGATRALPWNLRLLPMLLCAPDAAMFSDCAPCPEDPVRIRALLVNDGLLAVPSVDVEFRVDGVPVGRQTAVNVPPNPNCLASGMTVDLSQAFSSGVHQVSVVVNPDFAVLEPTYSDNTFSGELPVGCPATVDLSAGVLPQAGPLPAVGDTVRGVDIQVSNRGSAAATGVTVRVTVDGEFLCDLAAGTVPRRSTRTLRCDTPFVVTHPVCEMLVRACADPFNQIQELDESNNCGQREPCPETVFDLGLDPDLISITPQQPAAGDTVNIRVGLLNLTAAPGVCELSVEWLSGGTWLPIGTAPLVVPPDQLLVWDLAAFAWVVPTPLPISLRFEIRNIVPADSDPGNNVLVGTLPWHVPIPVPVAIRDWGAQSTADGVRIGWQCGDPRLSRFALERRTDGGANWLRLHDPIPASGGPATQTYQYLDRDAPAGTRLEYRLVGVLFDRGEEILGTLTVLHEVFTATRVRLWPVRPQPFRAGSALEFSLPAARNVDLQVFDSAGRRVASLAHGTWPAGRHAIAWNGLDLANRRVPAGVYFARLVCDSYRQTRRLVLVR